MFCPQCGTKVNNGAKFCPSCGYKLPSVEGTPTATISETPPTDISGPNVDPGGSGIHTGILVFGLILFLAGVVALVYGISMNNSLEHQLDSFFSSGSTDPGTVWIVLGAICGVAGVMGIIGAFVNRKE